MDCLYVVAFSNGVIKVGRTNDPLTRLTQHRERVACMGIEQVDIVHFCCENASAEREARLIAKCAEECTKRHKNEWFEGLTFEQVRVWAEECAYQPANLRELATDAGLAMPDFRAIVGALRAAGYGQVALASMCGVGQSSISDIATGKTTDPSYSVGAALIRAYRDLAQDTQAT